MEDILAETKPENNPLLAPVLIPEDENAVLKSDHPATNILSQSGIVVQRQIEWLNVFAGLEQANRYVILDPHGQHIGYMAEHTGNLGKKVTRQLARTHRAFTTHVFDKNSREVLRFQRPFSWINTRIRVYDAVVPDPRLATSTATTILPGNHADPDLFRQLSTIPISKMRIIGEAHSEWAPLRRKYNLFLSHQKALRQTTRQSGTTNTREASFTSQALEDELGEGPNSYEQFAHIDEPFLSWDFSLRAVNNRLIGTVSRDFRGFGREIFTDTGSYALRMDSAAVEDEAEERRLRHPDQPTLGGRNITNCMTLDQRAVMLATAVTVDFDYFSRHSSNGTMGFMPLWMWGGGGEAAGAGAAGAAGAAEASETAAVVGGAGRAVGGAALGEAGAAEGAMVGAGTMAGYEAMSRSARSSNSDPSAPGQADGIYDTQSPQSSYDSQSPQSGWDSQSPGGDTWGEGQDPWRQGAKESGGGEGDEEGGIFKAIWDSLFG